MSVIYLKDKNPDHQRFANLRRAVQTMQVSLVEQNETVAEHRGNIKELKSIMKEMRQHMLRLDKNLGKINIARLDIESRKITQIVTAASV